eukprot:gene10657-17612_t
MRAMPRLGAVVLFSCPRRCTCGTWSVPFCAIRADRTLHCWGESWAFLLG